MCFAFYRAALQASPPAPQARSTLQGHQTASQNNCQKASWSSSINTSQAGSSLVALKKKSDWKQKCWDTNRTTPAPTPARVILKNIYQYGDRASYIKICKRIRVAVEIALKECFALEVQCILPPKLKLTQSRSNTLLPALIYLFGREGGVPGQQGWIFAARTASLS